MTIKYTKQALKALKYIPNPQRERILNGINELPNGDVKKLKGSNGTKRLRVGDYRITFELDFVNLTCIIIDIRPRGSAYKE